MSFVNITTNNYNEITVESYLSLIDISELSEPLITDYISNPNKKKSPNSFIFFRMNVKQLMINKGKELNMRTLSTISSILWKQLDEEVKEKYKQISLNIKEEHLQNKKLNIQNIDFELFEETLQQPEPQILQYQYHNQIYNVSYFNYSQDMY
jgi:hypothetical protein